MPFITQNRVILYVQPDGPGTAMKPLSLDKHGMADKVMPGPGRSVIFGRDEFGRFVSKITPQEAPGGLNTSTIEEDGTGTITFLSKMFDRVGCFPVQERYVECGRLDGPNWKQLWHYGDMTITQKTHGAGPSREASDTSIFDTYEVSWAYTVDLLRHALTALTVGEDQNINDIAVLSDLVVGCQDCFPGYGPDEIMYLAVDSNTGSPGDYANVWYTVNGGGAWAATSTNPFAVEQDIKFIEMAFLSDTQFRVIVVNDQTTGQLKYDDITLGAEGTTSWSDAVTIGAAAVEALAWLFYDRVYIAVAGDIYVSTNQGESFGSAVYTGTAALNAFAKSHAGDVWAVGATNTILRERNQSDTFETMVGPSGGGTFYSVFEASDGRVYAGNGQSLYVSTNRALNAGGWTELKDFGSNKTVVKINCAGGSKSQGGDSQLVRVVVDDTTGGVGEVWESEDGGTTFRQVDELTNTGYNSGVYFSAIDDNLAFIPGDGGVLHKLSSKV